MGDSNYEIAEEFYNNFDSKLIKDFQYGNKRLLSAIKFVLRNISKNSKRILDVGCGIGYTSFEIAKNYNDSFIYGIDLSPDLINVASNLFKLTNLKYQNGNAVSIKSNISEKFDHVVFVDVLEHIKKSDHDSFFNDLNSILSEDFKIIISIPSPSYQSFLKKRYPEKIQPVDESITLMDLNGIAIQLGGNISHYSYQSIWHTNDYCYCIIQKNITISDKPRLKKLKLLSSSERKKLLIKNDILKNNNIFHKIFFKLKFYTESFLGKW